VLPKLDFGLELLYGATDHGSGADLGGSTIDSEQQKDTAPGQVLVHGAVKKTF
jgi:hypothetical protein